MEELVDFYYIAKHLYFMCSFGALLTFRNVEIVQKALLLSYEFPNPLRTSSARLLFLYL